MLLGTPLLCGDPNLLSKNVQLVQLLKSRLKSAYVLTIVNESIILADVNMTNSL